MWAKGIIWKQLKTHFSVVKYKAFSVVKLASDDTGVWGKVPVSMGPKVNGSVAAVSGLVRYLMISSQEVRRVP